MKMIVIGAYGRFGSRICKLAEKDPSFEIIRKIGRGETIDEVLNHTDVVLDVSTPDALEVHLPKIVAAKKPLVIGSTGHSPSQQKKIAAAGKLIPLYHSSNFAPGISIIKKILPDLPNGRFELIDNHHSHKKDAPSGTAKDFASLLPSLPILTSIREGDTIGEHTLILHLPHERIEIKHTALSRDLFAYGALNACRALCT